MSNNWSDLVFDFVILLDGEKVEVRNRISDVIQWEKNHKGVSFVATAPAISDLMWVAWAAARRAGLTTDDFNLWAGKIEDFAANAVTHEMDPTNAGQPDGSSHD